MSPENGPRRSSRFRATCLALAFALTSLVGCGGYPEVSDRTYEIATAIHGICNREQTENLPVAEKLVEDSLLDGSISEKEAGWLLRIIETARSGDWDAAESEAKRLMSDQTG